MVDLAMGWTEIHTAHSARSHPVSNEVELSWLTRYPLPSKVIVDWGNEILAEFKTIIQVNCGIEVKHTTSRNPQPYSILERVYQTIANIICTSKVQDMVVDDENLWDRSLESTLFALRAKVHTRTLK